MFKMRHLAGLAMTLALILAQAGQAAAAPLADPLVGTITGISEGTDSGGTTVIVVNYTDTDGNPQTTQLSLADAEQLGLITVDPITGEITYNATVGGSIDLTSLSGALGESDPCAPSGDSAQVTDTTTSATTTETSA